MNTQKLRLREIRPDLAEKADILKSHLNRVGELESLLASSHASVKEVLSSKIGDPLVDQVIESRDPLGRLLAGRGALRKVLRKVESTLGKDDFGKDPEAAIRGITHDIEMSLSRLSQRVDVELPLPK